MRAYIWDWTASIGSGGEDTTCHTLGTHGLLVRADEPLSFSEGFISPGCFGDAITTRTRGYVTSVTLWAAMQFIWTTYRLQLMHINMLMLYWVKGQQIQNFYLTSRQLGAKTKKSDSSQLRSRLNSQVIQDWHIYGHSQTYTVTWMMNGNSKFCYYSPIIPTCSWHVPSLHAV